MEGDQNLSAIIKVEPIEIKSEIKDELLVGITAQGIAGEQEFKDAMEPISGLGGIKTEPTGIKSEPKDEPSFVEFTAQDVVGGGQKFKEESDNDSQGPEIQADNQSGFHAFNDNEVLVMKHKLEEGQSENESVGLSTLYKSKKGMIIEKKDKPKVIKEPLSKVSPSEYTILESKRVQCNYCATSTKALSKMRWHIRNNHRDRDTVKLYKCSLCPYTSKHGVSKHIISKHKGDEDVEYFECHTCGKRCKFKNHLVTHVKSHRTREELMQTNEMYKCEQCPKMFCYKDSLGEHIKYFHNNSNNELQCDHCAYRCRRRQHLMFHIQKKHTPLDQLKTLKCPECDFTTKFEVNLSRHKYGRHRQKLQCSKCPFQTHRRRNLNDHEMTQHKNLQEEDKKYKCKKCDYETYNKSSLKTHSSTHRREDKKYKCNKCDYRTYKSTYLKNHSLTHLKPEEIQYFYCYHCNFKAKRKDNLSVHIRRHCKVVVSAVQRTHAVTANRIVASSCSFGNTSPVAVRTTKPRLKREQKVEFACHICDFKTKKKQIYSLHINEHNGMKLKLILPHRTYLRKTLTNRNSCD